MTVSAHVRELQKASRKRCYYKDIELSRAKTRERNRAWRKANPDRAKAKNREWGAKNRDKRNAYGKRRLEENGDWVRKLNREGHRWRAYGLTPEGYQEMLAAQGGRCAICATDKPHKGALHVDHDHDTGEVRGLLCFCCNAGIGKLKDDPRLLVKALWYLTRKSEVKTA